MPQRLKPDSTSESNDLRNAGLKVTLPRLKILDILADVGVKSVKLPPRSPNLNAHAERFVRTIKESQAWSGGASVWAAC